MNACTFCGREVFGRDAHPCCVRFWTRETGCPSCIEARKRVHRSAKPAGPSFETTRTYKFPPPITEATGCTRCRRSASQHCDVHGLRCCPGECPNPDRFSPPQPYILETTREVAA